MVWFFTAFSNFVLLSQIYRQNINLNTNSASKFNLAFIILSMDVDPECLIILELDLQIWPLFLQVVFKIVLGNTDLSLSKLAIFEDLFEVHDSISNNLVRCKEVSVPSLECHSVVLSWHSNFIYKSIVERSLTVLISKVSICLTGVLLRVKEGSAEDITGTFSIHHFDFLGAEDAKTNLEVFRRSRLDIKQFEFVLWVYSGGVDLKPALQHTLGNS